MIVRNAEEKDMEQVLDLCCDGALELSKLFDGSKPNRSIIKDFLDIRKDFPCLVIEHNERIVGVAPLMSGFHWWNGEPYLTSLFVYLTPAARKTGAVKILYDRIKQICSKYNIDYVDHYMSSKSSEYVNRITDKVDLEKIGIIVRY